MTPLPATTVSDDLAPRLRIAAARLARLLRQQDQGGFGPTLSAALSTVVGHGPLTLGSLAAREQVARPTITKVVEKLEAQGYVTKRVDPNDRRSFMVVATASGRRHLAAARTRRTAWLASRLAELTPDELAKLDAAVGVLEKITTAPDDGNGP